MNTSDIHIIITKFFSQEAEKHELDQLDQWLEKPENKKEFHELEKLWFGAETLGDFSEKKKTAKARYQKFIQEDKAKTQKRDKLRKLNFNLFKYAAILVGAAFGTYLIYYSNQSIENLPQIVEFTEMQAPTQDEVFIKTESGEIVVLNEQEAKELKASDGTLIKKDTGEKLAYHSKSASDKQSVMHELGVPRGKRVDLVLADGTKVWLNSESVLKYPTQFDQKERVVLLEGEAYFEVAKNAKRPFIVKTSDLNVRVLGTAFNLSTYKTSESIDLTLVEGKVGMYKKEIEFNPAKAVLVDPNQQASYSKTEKNMNLTDCDPSIYCSWRTGRLQFRQESFSNLKIKLERWYDIDIENQNEGIRDIAFTGDFDNENINQVMETLKRNTGIDYQIEGNTIKILP